MLIYLEMESDDEETEDEDSEDDEYTFVEKFKKTMKTKEQEILRLQKTLTDLEKNTPFAKCFIEDARRQVKAKMLELQKWIQQKVDSSKRKLQKKGRTTPSVQHLASERIPEEEGTGSYMEFIGDQVQSYYTTIKENASKIKKTMAKKQSETPGNHEDVGKDDGAGVEDKEKDMQKSHGEKEDNDMVEVNDNMPEKVVTDEEKEKESEDTVEANDNMTENLRGYIADEEKENDEMVEANDNIPEKVVTNEENENDETIKAKDKDNMAEKVATDEEKEKENEDNMSDKLFTDEEEENKSGDSIVYVPGTPTRTAKRKRKLAQLHKDLFGGESDSDELEYMEKKMKNKPKKTPVKKRKQMTLDSLIVSKKFTRKDPGAKFGKKTKKEEEDDTLSSGSSDGSSDENERRSRPRQRQPKTRTRRRQRKESVSPDDRRDPNYNPHDDSDYSEEEPDTQTQRESTEEEDDINDQKQSSEEEKTENDRPKEEKPNDEDNSDDNKTKTGRNRTGDHKRERIRCPRCNKPLSKSRYLLKRHYAAKHPMVPHGIRDDEVEIVCKKLMPIRKDGTRSTDVTAKPDRRNRRRDCLHCGRDFSDSHLRADHLCLDSKNRCDSIPLDELAKTRTPAEKKAWTSAQMKKCKLAKVTGPTTIKKFTADTYFKVDDLLELVYKRMISISGKYHLDTSIKDKKRLGKRLTPEEHKLWYRPIAVKHLQKRVLDHIYGDREFQLKDIVEVGDWMQEPEDEKAFFNSRLVRKSKDVGRDEPLTYSTINSLALATMEVLKFVHDEYNDREVREGAAKAMARVRMIAKNGDKKSRHLAKRKGFMEPEYYLVPLKEIKKFQESTKHRAIMKKAAEGVEYMIKHPEQTALLEYLLPLYNRKEIYDLQCHLAVLLTMATGKRPGVICALENAHVGMNSKSLTKFYPEKCPDEWAYRIEVAPTCKFAKLKTVEVAYVNVQRKMLHYLRLLGFLRVTIDRSGLDDRLFTSSQKYPLTDIDDQMKKAWKDGGLTTRFNSTMLRHTIVTQARADKSNLSVQELVALARGMDHSVRTAEAKYWHNKQLKQTEVSKIINNVLELNGNEQGWRDEMTIEAEELYDDDIMTGKVQVLDNEKWTDDSDDDDDDDGGPPKKKVRKIGKSEVIFSTKQTELVRNIFSQFIKDRVEKEDTINTAPMEEIFDKNMKDIRAESPYAQLFKFKRNVIWTKVRTLITQDKRKKKSAERGEKRMEEARMKPKGKKGNVSNPKL